MLIRCIDFETTGEPGGEERHAVCEVGWTDIRVSLGNPVTVSVGMPCSLVCDPGRSIPPEAKAVHHITEAEVADMLPAADVLQELTFGNPTFFCAHNADFERAFFDGRGVPFICTYKVALRVWPDAPSHNLQFLRYWLDLDIVHEIGLPAHRAGPDSYVGAALLARILTSENAPDFETMLRWSNGPPLLTRVTFGKHKGALWDDLPTDYLEWILDKSEMDRNTKINALHRLRQRGAR